MFQPFTRAVLAHSPGHTPDPVLIIDGRMDDLFHKRHNTGDYRTAPEPASA
jgi:hypothetical protein